MKRERTGKEIELLEELANKIKFACESENVNMHIVAAITGTNYRTYSGAITGSRDITTSSLMRIMDVLGYEVAFIKRKNTVRLLDNPDYIARYNAYKLKNANVTRKKRGQKPLTGNEGPRVKVKHRGISDKQFNYTKSRREEINKHREEQDDIFSIT